MKVLIKDMEKALGGPEIGSNLLDLKWDYIFFTGHSTGKIVAKKAAEHLTPTTLELGGKNLYN